MILQHRPVKADDIQTICSFPLDARELFYMFPKAQYPLTEAQLSDAITQRFDSTIVETGNRVVGFANFYRAETGGICCIGNVIVAHEARGKGVATFIVETMTALAFDRYNATEVQISCFNENTAGLLLYPKLGFLPFAVEERVSVDRGRSALIHMTRRRPRRP
ncbi:GNAT family N-acetyltransferase [Pseudomonas carnis]|jgi:RimJ/RimL family protein N-acetyltransferase|uniref:GNAT family N-acetyltransferase n=1 Tax=Pseudomonas TaxID=286 RepID=UPI00058C3450|nr:MULTISPECIES: GNAT family protein [Pseudomonas]MBA1254788.1 GNAT family N-acetyltransferase [Pseudomonas carnis]QVM99916.1 GNAT family N-acetyltransferase [Pseudomonas rhodesiae]